LLGFGFGEQRVGMTVKKFPALAFTAEEFGDAQVERDWFWSATQVSSGSLEPNPVGQALAGRHMEDLKLPLAAALETRRIPFVL
jgi:hypothetical protein